MRFIETGIAGAKVIQPTSHQDERGQFMRGWCVQELAEHGLEFVPVQANLVFSYEKGTVRGMHLQQAPALEKKLVRCTRGALFDVVLDLRAELSTFGQWYGVELTAENRQVLYVPENCAHGCQTLEDGTEICYMTSAFFTPKAVRGVRFDDPAFDIKWPLVATVISEQDRSWPLVARKETV